MTKRSDSGAALGQRILERLKNSEFWTAKTRTTGDTIQELKCPVCGKSAWAYTVSPMSINCNKTNSCNARTKTLELFPELRRDVERDCPATKADPHRPAREYLLSRGITPEALKGVDYRYQANARQTGSGAVMFFVGKDDKGKEILNGRLFNPPSGEGKTHNSGSTAGRYWRHLGHTYDPAQPVYITEGILDALSLHTLGAQAVAVLAAGQGPGKVDLTEFQNLVLAFDNDDAGRRAVKKWKQAHPLAEAVLCDPGADWNDLLNSGTIEQAKKQFQTALPRYRANGKLALAETAHKWAEIFTDFHGYPPGLFEFNSQTYFAVLKSPKSGEPYLDVTRCLRAALTVKSFTLDRANPARPQYNYNLAIQAKDRQPFTITATGRDLANTRALNEFLLSTARIPWEGDPKAATALQVRITGDKRAPEVVLLPVIGYQPDVNAYVFPRWGVDPAGKLLTPDSRGHFRISYRHTYQPPAHGEGKCITPATITRQRAQDIYRLLLAAWGHNGAVALAWTVAGWFVNQIKETKEDFPHLSLYGEAASGKSTLARLLNAIQGREGEGVPINQLNSKKGIARTIGQLSGLFTALLEDSKRNEKGFDYSIVLTGFNKSPLQIQGAFSGDLQTKETQFLGTLLFVQNDEPFNSQQERERFISLRFKKEDRTDSSKAAYEKLMATSKAELAGIMQQVLQAREHFEKSWPQALTTAAADLAPISEDRIHYTHSLTLAFHRLFCDCFGIKEDPATVNHFADLARRKCITSAIRQATVADHFFEQLDTLTEAQAEGCYHVNQERGLIFVNLPRVETILRSTRGLNFQASPQFCEALQQHPSFFRNGLGYRFPGPPEEGGDGRPKKRRAWAFSLEWHKNNRMDAEDIREL